MKEVTTPHPESELSPEQRTQTAGDGFVYHKSSQPWFKLVAVAKDLETSPKLWVNAVRKQVYNIPQLINFLDLLEKSYQGRIKLHGAVVLSPSGKGYFITGWNDIGKTTTTLHLGKMGYGVLADDYFWMDEKGICYQAQNKAGLFPHPDNLAGIKLSSSERLLAAIKLRISKLAFLHKVLSPNFYLPYSRFGKDISTAQINEVLVLEPGNIEPIRDIDKVIGLDKIINTSLRLWRLNGFPQRIVEHYCFANNIKATILTDRAEQIVASALKNIKVVGIKGNNFQEYMDQVIKYVSEREPVSENYQK